MVGAALTWEEPEGIAQSAQSESPALLSHSACAVAISALTAGASSGPFFGVFQRANPLLMNPGVSASLQPR
jgi:hypothetical protein